ncbi:winged helix-turn-helix transcriptional regulator [Paenibacillus sp. LHD-117]|uniref:ArsR/SmtB family transcription factor n=1 Tax=Paenibacillus sp. LHD-117 TaxID=3071412 RepID=UPI0027DFC513|nr:winged helix-turn-helix transcriptional regulator [Paenibacillus sp. LHD-117]MDQ6423150.1 winged helix-turn-helix transcriptional regulator [Paenibacillus sp. LHD-117]
MLELSINEPDQLVKVAHALSSHTRLKIIKLLLNYNNMNINEIGEKLGIPVSTAGINVKVLEEAGLILTEILPASRGAMKVCKRNFDDVRLILNPIKGYKNKDQVYEIEMPIGHFVDIDVQPTCGIANTESMVIPEDDPFSFFVPECRTAEIIWLRQGWIEYRFPRSLPRDIDLKAIEFSLEICSEAPNFNNDWPSDITIWMNNVEIGTWTSPGDFGDRRGKNNPEWWHDSSTQYGLLKTFRVDKHKSTVDNSKISDITLQDLNMDSHSNIRFKLGVKPDAVHKGGLNLFGRGFGNYDQDIIMKLHYESKEEQ